MRFASARGRGRNSGFMIDLPHVLTSGDYTGESVREQEDTRASRAAIRFAIEAALEYGLPDEAIWLAGKVNGAATSRGQAHNQGYARHLNAIGEPQRMLDAADMRDLTGSEYYLGGLFTPGTAMLQPALFARGIANGLRSNRVRIHDRPPVQQLARENGAWTATTPRGSVSGAKVILAVNCHVRSFGGFRNQLMHVMLYASMTRARTDAEVSKLGGVATEGSRPPIRWEQRCAAHSVPESIAS